VSSVFSLFPATEITEKKKPPRHNNVLATSAPARQGRSPSVARPSWPCARAGCPCHGARNLRGTTRFCELVLQGRALLKCARGETR
jgi:hypothetical protein